MRIAVTNGFTLIDKEDAHLLKEHHFYQTRGYIVSHHGGKMYLLHRLVLNAPAGMHVDHINGDHADNRRKNLRICSCAENIRNRAGRSKANKSGVTGVYWDKGTNKWRANIGYKGKTIYLGSSSSLAKAAKIRREAELRFFGEFAPKK